MTVDVDVVVVGAGPTGLMLAGDLARAGLSCAVFERHPERSGLTRAFAVHARTLEQLDARGVADQLVATGIPIRAARFLGDARLDLSRLPSRFPYVLITPQYQTERVLAERARSLGADIRYRAEVTGFTQSPDGVQVAVRADGQPQPPATSKPNGLRNVSHSPRRLVRAGPPPRAARPPSRSCGASHAGPVMRGQALRACPQGNACYHPCSGLAGPSEGREIGQSGRT